MKIEFQESGSEADSILHHLWRALRIRPPRHKDVQQKIARFFITIFLDLNMHGSVPIKNARPSDCLDLAVQPDQKEIRRTPASNQLRAPSAIWRAIPLALERFYFPRSTAWKRLPKMIR
jgi:hypothetical protein